MNPPVPTRPEGGLTPAPSPAFPGAESGEGGLRLPRPDPERRDRGEEPPAPSPLLSPAARGRPGAGAAFMNGGGGGGGSSARRAGRGCGAPGPPALTCGRLRGCPPGRLQRSVLGRRPALLLHPCFQILAGGVLGFAQRSPPGRQRHCWGARGRGKRRARGGSEPGAERSGPRRPRVPTARQGCADPAELAAGWAETRPLADTGGRAGSGSSPLPLAGTRHAAPVRAR